MLGNATTAALLLSAAIAGPTGTGAIAPHQDNLPIVAAAAPAANLEPPTNWGSNGTRLFSTCQFDRAVAIAPFLEDLDRAATFLDHQPDLVRDGTRLEISTTTYDTGGLTELDFALARAANRLLAARNARCQPQRLRGS